MAQRTDDIAVRYEASWCEENIWHLAQHPSTYSEERLVLAITGKSGHVACWQQRASEEGEGVLWDYHVVLATKTATWQIWDMDTRLGMPVLASTWLKETFPYPEFVPPEFHPRFATFEADNYVKALDSDRSHMRSKAAGWLKPPPPWPAIRGEGLLLKDMLLQARNGLSIQQLRRRML